MERPEFCKLEHLEFLDELRKSGVTNMYGAASSFGWVHFELNEKEKIAVLLYWMDSFGDENR